MLAWHTGVVLCSAQRAWGIHAANRGWGALGGEGLGDLGLQK